MLQRRRHRRQLAAVAIVAAMGALHIPAPCAADGTNLAAATAGGRIVAVSSNDGAASRLIDGNPTDGWKAAARFHRSRPETIVVELGGSGDTVIDRVVIRPRHWQGGRVAREIELAASTTAADSGFEVIGRHLLAPRKTSQEIRFAPRPARFLRLTILSVHKAGKPAIGEILVLAAPKTPPTATATAPAEPLAKAETAPPAVTETAPAKTEVEPPEVTETAPAAPPVRAEAEPGLAVTVIDPADADASANIAAAAHGGRVAVPSYPEYGPALTDGETKEKNYWLPTRPALPSRSADRTLARTLSRA